MLSQRVPVFRGVWACAAVVSHRQILVRHKRRHLVATHHRCYHCLVRLSNQLGAATAGSLVVPTSVLYQVPGRPLGMLAVRAVRGLLKLRYFVLGGSIAGGYKLKNSYEEFTNGLPDTEWLRNMMPSVESIDSFRGHLADFADNFKNSISFISFDSKLHQLYGDKMGDLRGRLQRRLEDAIEAAQSSAAVSDGAEDNADFVPNVAHSVFAGVSSASAKKESRTVELEERLAAMQQELMTSQLQYQRQLEQLEVDNKQLRQRLLLLTAQRSAAAGKHHKVKKSLIEMYSEVLDELSGYDSSYSTQDHLPRVVVVGDQSSGKTSVLEMIARARIFPRGAGEMMTRAPVKVTLCEGPYHIAQFKDSSREFDLTNEQHLKELRKEVEFRMRNSVRDGRTVSGDVIAMTVRGPHLQRMVLVDLPGVISTQTVDMAADTRDSIRAISQQHMANPNAIILCVQDGSIDAERSNVTDLVSKMDPTGKRTIFVLTKVDLAEENLTNPDRIRRILSGKLFPMKALGYFAVVTGRGNKDDSIDQIRDYEDNFFKSSKMFQSGVISSSQCTTGNLSRAVATCFWQMVRETVEQQADAFKATRFNLETEWKNNFPRLRELDRDELFERARGEILDEIVRLSTVSAQQWERQLTDRLWHRMVTHVFENIYLPAAQANDTGVFNTEVDIKLKQWADDSLPRHCVEVGAQTLEEEFRRFLARAECSPDHDRLFDALKWSAVEEALREHEWEPRAAHLLRVIQLNTLDDSSVPDRQQWHGAVDFLQQCVEQKLQDTEQLLHEMCGPGVWQRWLHWQHQSEQQRNMAAVRAELEKLLHSDENHGAQLAHDEVSAVKQNVQSVVTFTSSSCSDNSSSSSSTSGTSSSSSSSDAGGISPELIGEVWRPVYRRHFLRRTLARAADSRRSFWLYRHVQCGDTDAATAGNVAQRGSAAAATAAAAAAGKGGGGVAAGSEAGWAEADCDWDDVVLFWRIRQMIRATANTLRQQIVNREARRLEHRVKEVLEEWSVDAERKRSLLTGRRVTLAEELKKVRHIQEKLDEFIASLQQEK